MLKACRCACGIFILTLPLRYARGNAQPAPVLQLTAQPASCPDHEHFAGGTLLRELQRQALLISARDELGLCTRDMVLGEPFAAPGTEGAVTLVCSSQVQKGKSAQLTIWRFDSAQQPTDSFALAYLPVDRAVKGTLQNAVFPVDKSSFVNYPEFVARCEEASRTGYLDALKKEMPGDFSPVPTRWAKSDLPADKAALIQLQHLDVFSQYLAVRKLHTQLRESGASPSRLCALVRAYANLGQLTRNQWSQANKAFAARALVYAQRLVVHEQRSPISLYTRAYALAFVGLHAAALQDLADAHYQAGLAPEWVDLVKAWCDYDTLFIQSSLARTPGPNAQLAIFLSVRIANDGLPTDRQTAMRSFALTTCPGLFVFNTLETSENENAGVNGGNEVVSRLPTLLVHTLQNAELPKTVLAQIRMTHAGDDSYRQLAGLRKELISATTRPVQDSVEPSYCVLAELVEEQAFFGIVEHAITVGSGGPKVVQLLETSAQEILKEHPWKAYVDALSLEAADSGKLDQTLARVKDRDVGSWIAHTLVDRYQAPTASSKIIKGWLEAAENSTDGLEEDFIAPDPSVTTPTRKQEPLLAELRKTSPNSAVILLNWMRAHPISAVVKNAALFEETVKTIEDRFCDRPELLSLASDWCCARSDFPRSLALLQKLDALDPSPHTCDQLALVQNRLGNRARAIGNLIRGANLSDDTIEKAAMFQRAAHFLIQLHQFDSALSYVQASSEVPTVRVWQMSARCYEWMGRLKDADDAMSQLAMLDPSTVAQQYLWARRLKRPNAEAIHQQALAALAKPGENFLASFYICLADDQDQKALAVLRGHRDQMDDALQFAQLIVMGAKLHMKQVVNNNVNALHNRGGAHQEFGDAFKALVQTKNISQATADFNDWVDRQLDDEDLVDWCSLAGRYLVATGHVAEGKLFLIRGIRSTVREHENYFLAWRELTALGEKPEKLLLDASTQPRDQ